MKGVLVVILFLRSGLGNQMFTYAFARALQENSNTHEPIYINDYMFKNDKQRSLSIQHFKLNDTVRYDSGIRKYFHLLQYLFYKKVKCAGVGGNDENRYNSWAEKGIFLSDGVHGYVEYKKATKFSAVFGFFQNLKYFDDVKEIIKNEFKISTPPSEANVNMIKKIESTNSVCVHIRRGDFLDPKWKHINLCTKDYYLKAIDYIKANVENPVFYIFSNTHEDIEWIKKNYDFSGLNVEFADLNNPDYEELRLMYSCKHFIISNSTFSWWAQYLGNNPQKVVVAPNKWNLLDAGPEAIYMPEWHLIEV